MVLLQGTIAPATPESGQGGNPCQGDLDSLAVFRKMASGTSFGSGRMSQGQEKRQRVWEKICPSSRTERRTTCHLSEYCQTVQIALTWNSSMSRRSGQSGSIQKDGKWYVVRFWKDVAGTGETAASVGENLPEFRPRQTLSLRTGTQGQGVHRGQRSGYRGVFQQCGETDKPQRCHLPRAGRDLARKHAQ